MSTYAWVCTASEDTGELATLASGVGGTVLPENETLYPAITVESETQPASMTFTNSGTVYAELVGGLSPQKPK